MSDLQMKIDSAISVLRHFAPVDDSYYLCYSGGKDSDCIRILAELSGVSYTLNHNLTTMDAPETVNYVRSIPNIIIHKSYYDDGRPKTIWNMIPVKKLPPTRIARWCCSEFKEKGGKGKLKVTGVRWSESRSRALNADTIRIIGKFQTTKKYLDSIGANYRITPQGGIVLGASTGDNESLRDCRDFVHQCFRDRSLTVNPIVDWSDNDVWTFLKYYGCSSNPLYHCGEKRIGCIGCPLSGSRSMKHDFKLYPKYKQNYIRAFDKMLVSRLNSGLPVKSWRSDKDVFKWWIGEDVDQLTFFDDDTLDEIMWDMMHS